MSEDRHDEEQRHSHRRYERRASGLFGGLILILLGVLFFLSSQGLLPHDEWWQFFLVGLGVIFLIDYLARYSDQDHHRPGSGRLIAGLILILVGAAFLLGVGTWWPLILIVIGLAILLNVWLRK